MAYKLRGYIVGNDDKEHMDYWGIESSCPKDIENWLESDDDKTLFINSYGGSLIAGVDIYHMVRSSGVDVVITCLAASAASIVAVGGKTVTINPAGQIMIHNVSGSAFGDYRAMKNEADTLETLNRSVRAAYRLKVNVSDDELIDMMDNETWLDAETARHMGFVDDILFEDEEIQNPFDLKNMYSASRDFYNCHLKKSVKPKPGKSSDNLQVFKNQIQINNNRRKILI